MPIERTPIVAGNWKMHVSPAEAVPMVRSLRDPLGRFRGVEVILCPPSPALTTVADLLRPTRIEVGAQNCHWEDEGAFTGEISARMLQGTCRYVLVGHSERRAMFGDTDEVVRRKMGAALRAGLVPILCVGEDLARREQGLTTQVVASQVITALDGLDVPPQRLVVAYEPVWAIGTGKACPPAMANQVIGFVVRGALAELYGNDRAQQVRILYGGSVTDANALEYFSLTDIDGALVGGASLKRDAFIGISRAAHEARRPVPSTRRG